MPSNLARHGPKGFQNQAFIDGVPRSSASSWSPETRRRRRIFVITKLRLICGPLCGVRTFQAREKKQICIMSALIQRMRLNIGWDGQTILGIHTCSTSLGRVAAPQPFCVLFCLCFLCAYMCCLLSVHVFINAPYSPGLKPLVRSGSTRRQHQQSEQYSSLQLHFCH